MSQLLAILLALPVSAQPSHLEDQGFASTLVELKDSSLQGIIDPVTVIGSGSFNVTGSTINVTGSTVSIAGTVNTACVSGCDPSVNIASATVAEINVASASVVNIASATVIIPAVVGATQSGVWKSTITPQGYAADAGYYYRVDVGTVNLTPADLDFNMFLIVNLATNTKTLKLDWLEYINHDPTDSAIMRAVLNPVVTSSGTAMGIKSGNLGLPSGSQMQVYRQPTISSRSNTVMTSISGPETYHREDYRFAVQLPPGNTLLFTGNPQTNNMVVGLRLNWVEE